MGGCLVRCFNCNCGCFCIGCTDGMVEKQVERLARSTGNTLQKIQQQAAAAGQQAQDTLATTAQQAREGGSRLMQQAEDSGLADQAREGMRKLGDKTKEAVDTAKEKAPEYAEKAKRTAEEAQERSEAAKARGQERGRQAGRGDSAQTSPSQPSRGGNNGSDLRTPLLDESRAAGGRPSDSRDVKVVMHPAGAAGPNGQQQVAVELKADTSAGNNNGDGQSRPQPATYKDAVKVEVFR